MNNGQEWVERHRREGGREGASDGTDMREGGSDDDRQGERVSGGREGRRREGC